MRMWKFFMVFLVILGATGHGAFGANEKLAFLKVSPLAGESRTSKSGGSGGLIRSATLTAQNTSKTVTRSMKWNCEVRYRGEPKPGKVEVRAFYIGYEANDMTPKILGKEVKSLTLDENGKASVELESPTVSLHKSRTSSGGFSGHSGRIAKSKSTTRGQRMAGCVVQLFEDGELVKSYASMSQWDRAAKEKDFSDAVLSRKDKNRLN